MHGSTPVMRLEKIVLACLASLGMGVGCHGSANSGAAPPQAKELDTPSRPGSGEPNLTVAPDGSFLLSWIEPTGEGSVALRHARREPGGDWMTARTVATGDDWFVNWADFPSLGTLPDGTLIAHWLKKSGPGKFAYDVQLAVSGDGGEIWSEPFAPHQDGTTSEHGFVSMAPEANDRMGVAWLDGRSTEEGGAMALMFASVTAAGSVGEETLLDPRVCDCCQTGMARTDQGLLVVYRDRTEAEIRDISYVRFDGEIWSEPRTLFPDGWEMHGCPVNGPSVAARGSHVVVAWFTAPEAQGLVRLIQSEDGGQTWGAPVRVDSGEPIGRVQVAVMARGGALVTWLEAGDGGTFLAARRLESDGSLGPVRRVADSSASRSSGFPRLAVSGQEGVFAWSDSADPLRVRTAVVQLR